MTKPQRMIIGISGATGVIYGVRLLQVLKQQGIETHLIVTKAGEMTRAYETDLSMQQLRNMADVWYPITDVGAAISSGSFKTMGMIIAPCSIRTMSEIAHGITSTLLTRAADVVLKERRRLVLMVRETPLTAGHIKSMLAVTESGGIIAPPMPAFYIRPQTIDDLVNHAVGRVLDLFDIEMDGMQRWGETPALKEEVHTPSPASRQYTPASNRVDESSSNK
jgi:flavin prenyltransferase